MSMTTTMQKYFADNGVAYDVLPHSATSSCLSAANSIHVNGHMVAKPVILEDETGYLMAVIPATEHVKMARLNRILDRDMILAREDELLDLFSDCDVGAIPPIASAYGMQTIIDDDLLECSDIYFEAGNHRELIHIKGRDFQRLMRGAPHSKISLH